MYNYWDSFDCEIQCEEVYEDFVYEYDEVKEFDNLTADDYI